jgi:hypothetical protein
MPPLPLSSSIDYSRTHRNLHFRTLYMCVYIYIYAYIYHRVVTGSIAAGKGRAIAAARRKTTEKKVRDGKIKKLSWFSDRHHRSSDYNRQPRAWCPRITHDLQFVRVARDKNKAREKTRHPDFMYYINMPAIYHWSVTVQQQWALIGRRFKEKNKVVYTHTYSHARAFVLNTSADNITNGTYVLWDDWKCRFKRRMLISSVIREENIKPTPDPL